MKDKFKLKSYNGIWKVSSDDRESYYKTYKDAYDVYNNYYKSNYYTSHDPYENSEELELKRRAKLRNEKIDLILGK